MRSKINIRKLQNYMSGACLNDIYRKFGKQFSALLHPDHYYNTPEYIKRTYIQKEAEEKKLNEIVGSQNDSFTYVLGFTGSGKTTFIKNTFGCFNNNPFIANRQVYFPIFCDSTDITEKNFESVITSKITSVRKCIESEYGFRLIMEGHEANYMLFHEFVKNNKPELLSLDMSNPFQTEKEELMSLIGLNRFAYEMELVKFYCNENKIKKLIFILDDIESLEFAVEKRIIRKFLRMYECLRNNDNRTYNIKCIIAGRQITHRMLLEESWFDAYRHEKYLIPLTGMENLSNIFKVRFDALTDKIFENSKPGNIETWKEAYNILCRLADNLFIKFGSTILKLNNYNISESMLSFQNIISNRCWIQNSEPYKDSFSVKEENFLITNEKVLKALGCGEGRIYFDNNDTPIKNILFNEKVEGYELIPIYVIKYLLANCEECMDENYSIVDLSWLFESVNGLFPFGENCRERFDKVVARLFEKKVIFKNPNEDEKNMDKVYLSPRGEELWRIMCQNSILLELYREDIWKENDSEYSFEESENLAKIELFLDNVKYLRELFEVEKNIIMWVKEKGNVTKFQNLFGSELIAQTLLKSIKNSAKNYFTNENDDCNKINNQLSRFKEDINTFIGEIKTQQR